jgi:hypothetical protein
MRLNRELLFVLSAVKQLHPCRDRHPCRFELGRRGAFVCHLGSLLWLFASRLWFHGEQMSASSRREEPWCRLLGSTTVKYKADKAGEFLYVWRLWMLWLGVFFWSFFFGCAQAALWGGGWTRSDVGDAQALTPVWYRDRRSGSKICPTRMQTAGVRLTRK